MSRWWWQHTQLKTTSWYIAGPTQQQQPQYLHPESQQQLPQRQQQEPQSQQQQPERQQQPQQQLRQQHVNGAINWLNGLSREICDFVTQVESQNAFFSQRRWRGDRLNGFYFCRHSTNKYSFLGAVAALWSAYTLYSDDSSSNPMEVYNFPVK